MEVHHHVEKHHPKKKFREYFLEFLMIFLAVTLGFLAESLREHITENKRAELYARSLYEDYRADTLNLHQLIDYTQAKILHIDSLSYYIQHRGNRQLDSTLYGGVLYLTSTFQFDNVNGTYEQIKNSGSLRFYNQALVNNLNHYDAAATKLKLMEDWENKFLYEKIFPQTQQMFNYKVFDDLRDGGPIRHDLYLRGLSSEAVDLFLNQALLIKRLRERQLVQQTDLLDKAKKILADLKKEYNLEG